MKGTLLPWEMERWRLVFAQGNKVTAGYRPRSSAAWCLHRGGSAGPRAVCSLEHGDWTLGTPRPRIPCSELLRARSVCTGPKALITSGRKVTIPGNQRQGLGPPQGSELQAQLDSAPDMKGVALGGAGRAEDGRTGLGAPTARAFLLRPCGPPSSQKNLCPLSLAVTGKPGTRLKSWGCPGSRARLSQWGQPCAQGELSLGSTPDGPQGRQAGLAGAQRGSGCISRGACLMLCPGRLALVQETESRSRL